jgi:hypothetical protein
MAAGPLLLPPALSLGACLATSCHAQGGLLFTTIRPLSRGSLLDEPSVPRPSRFGLSYL